MTRKNALILAALYEVRGQDKDTASWKTARIALPQVAVAYQAGHKVNMQNIMQHKFMLVSNPTGRVCDLFTVVDSDICHFSSNYPHKEQVCLAATFATANADKLFDRAFGANCFKRNSTFKRLTDKN